ncbi:MAG: LEA type 2 family protein [Deltaproteobacteria bacterium]|nr:LEA type 2 family protein [Deltaproteobacteria bacterium]
MHRILLPLLPLLAACSELDPYLPTVTFDRLDVKSVDWAEISTDFVFRVDNPNPVEVPLARFDYSLVLGGVELLSGDDPDGLVLLASDASELALPADLVFASVYETVQAVRGDDAVPFVLSGSFGFDTPVGQVDVPYDADGDFPALRTPAIDLGTLRVTNLSVTEIDLGLDLHIDNDHGSTLWFQDFDYTVSLAGTQAAEGLVDLGGVEGASLETVELPITIDNLSVISALYDVLTGDAVQVGLDAVSNVDTPFGMVPLAVDESGNVDIGE